MVFGALLRGLAGTVIISAAVVLVSACGTTGHMQRSDARVMLPPEDFVILPWGKAPADLKALQEIRDCGFNLVHVRPENVRLARKAGLQSMVEARISPAEVQLPPGEIEGRVAALVHEAGPKDGVFGYCLYDEPGKDLFPGLAGWVAALHQAAPEARTLINLFPNYATPAQLQAESYPEYLEDYVATVKPELLCYDHYALMEDGTVAEAASFENLEGVRSEALKWNLPFWNVVLAQGCLGYAAPTDAGLRFQLYTTMAYGARGIVYWRYFAPARGNYRLAAIDQFGNKTPTWDMLRSVNNQAQCLGRILTGLKSVNVFHHPDEVPGASGLASSRFVGALQGGRFLVGEFEGPEGQPMVMVVNKSLERSVFVDITFSAPGTISVISAFTGERQVWGGENAWLAPGQGALLTLDPI